MKADVWNKSGCWSGEVVFGWGGGIMWWSDRWRFGRSADAENGVVEDVLVGADVVGERGP